MKRGQIRPPYLFEPKNRKQNRLTSVVFISQIYSQWRHGGKDTEFRFKRLVKTTLRLEFTDWLQHAGSQTVTLSLFCEEVGRLWMRGGSSIAPSPPTPNHLRRQGRFALHVTCGATECILRCSHVVGGAHLRIKECRELLG